MTKGLSAGPSPVGTGLSTSPPIETKHEGPTKGSCSVAFEINERLDIVSPRRLQGSLSRCKAWLPLHAKLDKNSKRSILKGIKNKFGVRRWLFAQHSSV